MSQHLLRSQHLMCLDAHGIVSLGITGHFLDALMPRPCRCCLHQPCSQSATTAVLIHIPPFDVGDWGRLTPFRVVPETHLDKPAESFPGAFRHAGEATLWCGEIG